MKTKTMLAALILCAGIATAAVTTERYTVYVTRTIGGRQIEIVHDENFSNRLEEESQIKPKRKSLI